MGPGQCTQWVLRSCHPGTQRPHVRCQSGAKPTHLRCQQQPRQAGVAVPHEEAEAQRSHLHKVGEWCWALNPRLSGSRASPCHTVLHHTVHTIIMTNNNNYRDNCCCILFVAICNPVILHFMGQGSKPQRRGRLPEISGLGGERQGWECNSGRPLRSPCSFPTKRSSLSRSTCFPV